MNNQLQVFRHEQFGETKVRVVNGDIYFLGKDITDALGYTNSRKALNDHCKNVTKLEVPHPQSNTKTMLMNFIPEPDLYRLIISSKLPSAEQFEKWVFEEVLPSIRKSGGYIANQENSTPEQILANAVLVAQNVIKEKDLQLEREKLLRQEAEETIKLQSPKVQAWEQLMDINKNLDMGATARAFNVSGLGRNNFMKLLRKQEILQKNNNPYQYYMDRGYFEVIVIPNEFAQTKTVVTPKGLKWLAGKLVEWGYIG